MNVRDEVISEPIAIVLQVIPDPLIRIQFRRVWRQEEQLQTTLSGVYKFGHYFRFMCRMAINDQEYPALRIMKKPLEEFDKYLCSHPTVDRHKTQLSLRANCRDQVQSKPCAGAAHHRRFR